VNFLVEKVCSDCAYYVSGSRWAMREKNPGYIQYLRMGPMTCQEWLPRSSEAHICDEDYFQDEQNFPRLYAEIFHGTTWWLG